MSIVMEVLRYIGLHWIEWAFVGLGGALALLWRWMTKKFRVMKAENDAIADGIQALLRSEIIDKYNYYKGKGYCPIYAKENMEKLYEPYHVLGGNDVATKLVNEALDMKTEKENENEQDMD